jgi:hypothetical protein
VVGGTGDVIGLLAAQRIYGREATVLADAAIAQDVVNLVLVAPLLVVLGFVAARGSVRAYLGWLGCLVFTVYNYAIYAFSVQFGPLFLLWVTVLGLAVFALVGGLSTLDKAVVANTLRGQAMRLSAWLLIALGSAFALLWLAEIVPDLLAGHASRSAGAWQVPTNPVHVLDLTWFLPAVITSCVLLLRGRPLGYATAPGQLVFVALTCLPILLTPAVATIRGHAASWSVLLPISVVLAATTVGLWRTFDRRPTSLTT